MIKTHKLRLAKRASTCLFLLLLLSINSCKKDLKLKASDYTGDQFSALAAGERISSAEIIAWLPQLPVELSDSLQLKNAQQSVIRGRMVVRIPLGNQLSLYFTKEGGVLKKYIYKWADEKPGQRKFTGKILSYSFQDDVLNGMLYKDGKIVKSGRYSNDNTLTDNSSRKVLMNIRPAKPMNANDDEVPQASLLSKIICALRHGTMDYGIDALHQGWFCNVTGGLPDWLTAIFGTGDEGSGTGNNNPPNQDLPPGVWVGLGNFQIPPNTLGGISDPDAQFGGGAVWVSTWQSDGNDGCNTPDNSEQSPTGVIAPSDGCTEGGHWQTYQVEVPPVEIDATTEDGSDDDTLIDLPVDNTQYNEYQTTDTWPSVEPVIPASKFVQFINGVECFVLSKRQLAQAGYTCDGWDLSTGRIFAIYNEHNNPTVNSSQAKKAITYVNDALNHGIPVLVGIDYAAGNSNNKDKTTDHYVVIVGSGTDTGGKFYRFYDSGTIYSDRGTSSLNKLYYNETTGKLTGSTQVGSLKNLTYTVTHIRKSLKL